MIYFLDKSENTIPGLPTHIGMRSEIHRYVDVNFMDVYLVQADGQELEQCLTILGRNSCPGRIHTFVGDAAREIFQNWR